MPWNNAKTSQNQLLLSGNRVNRWKLCKTHSTRLHVCTRICIDVYAQVHIHIERERKKEWEAGGHNRRHTSVACPECNYRPSWITLSHSLVILRIAPIRAPKFLHIRYESERGAEIRSVHINRTKLRPAYYSWWLKPLQLCKGIRVWTGFCLDNCASRAVASISKSGKSKFMHASRVCEFCYLICVKWNIVFDEWWYGLFWLNADVLGRISNFLAIMVICRLLWVEL